MAFEERRIHGRVTLAYPATLVVGDARYHVTVRQLSHGGAQLTLDGSVPRPGEDGELRIEPPEGASVVTFLCRIVHARSEAGEARVGVRLTDPEQTRADRVDTLIHALLGGSGGGARRHPRVHRRVEVACKSAEEIRAVMCNLSQGGLGLESQEPLTVGESIEVTVELPGFPRPLQLQGTVVHVQRREDGAHHAGVRFEQLAPERTGVLRDLIQFLASGGDGA